MTQIYGDESWFNEDAKFYKTTTITNLKVTNGAEIVGDVEVDGRLQKTQYEPGEIIETISTTCDGSTITVKSGSYTVSDVTTEQIGTTTYATVDGSEISYTPPTGTKRVHYRFWYHFDVTENSGISNHIMQIDGSDVYGSANNVASNYAQSNWHHACFPISVEYTINCAADSDDVHNAKFKSWSEPKTLRVQYREHSGSYESRLHYNTWWNGATSAEPYQIMKPHLTIQAIA